MKPGVEFVRADAVARRLGISRKRVYQLIAQRRLQGIRFGPRMVRVLRASVDQFVAEQLDADGQWRDEPCREAEN